MKESNEEYKGEVGKKGKLYYYIIDSKIREMINENKRVAIYRALE